MPSSRARLEVGDGAVVEVVNLSQHEDFPEGQRQRHKASPCWQPRRTRISKQHGTTSRRSAPLPRCVPRAGEGRAARRFQPRHSIARRGAIIKQAEETTLRRRETAAQLSRYGHLFFVVLPFHEFLMNCWSSLEPRRGVPWESSSITTAPIAQSVLVILTATADLKPGTTHLVIEAMIST